MNWKLNIYGIIIFLLFGVSTQAQFSDNFTQGARSLGMGGTGVMIQGIDGMRANQAGITKLDHWAIGIHTESRYLLTDIHSIGLDLATPTKYGHFGLSINSFGNDNFKQQKVGIAYARKLFKSLSIGGQFDVLNTSITNYGNSLNYTFELGLYSEIFSNLHAAAHIYSPGKVELVENEPIPSKIRFGMKFLVSEKFRILGEFDKNINDLHTLKFGVEYRIITPLELRLGVTTREGSYSFGLSYYYKQFAIDLGIVQHSVLGTSPALSVRYEI